MVLTKVLAAVLVAACPLAVGAARAEVTLDEARAAAERYAAHSLACAEGSLTGDPTAPFFALRETAPSGDTMTWVVDAATGVLFSWQRSAPPAGGESGETTPDQAIALASAEAERMVGSDALDLRWSVTPGADGQYLHLVGRGPLLGDPPRAGLSRDCSATVHLPSATLIEFTAGRTCDSVPAAVSVTRDEALAAARAACAKDEPSAGEAPLAEEPCLWQFKGQAFWTVRFETRSAERSPIRARRIRMYTVDAVSGEVVRRDQTDAARTVPVPPASPADTEPAAPAPTQVAGPSASRALPLAAGAALVLALAGTAVVVRRRRRAA